MLFICIPVIYKIILPKIKCIMWICLRAGQHPYVFSDFGIWQTISLVNKIILEIHLIHIEEMIYDKLHKPS